MESNQKGVKNNYKTSAAQKNTTDNNNNFDIDSNLVFENRIVREWLSTKEAAQYFSISENALRIMVHRGQIPVYKFGRRLRFKLSDCQELFLRKGA